MRLTRQQVKYGVAVFVSMSILAVFSSSCSGDCIAAVEKDKLSALIGQLQGQCCVYEVGSNEQNPSGFCRKRSNPSPSLSKYWCVSQAALCLGDMGKEASSAVPALIEALETGPNNYNTGDGIIPTRNDIMIALGQIGDPRAVKPLIAALHSPRLEDTHWGGYQRPQLLGQDTAMYALGLLGPTAKEAVPHIIPFLKSSDSNLFEAASKALVQIKDTKAIPPLTEALNHPTHARLALSALEEFGPLADQAVPDLVKIVETSTHVNYALEAANAIGKIRGKTAIPKISIMYEKKIIDFYEDLKAIFREYGYKGTLVNSSSDKERYYLELPNDEKLYVQLDRSVSNYKLTSGQVWIEREERKISDPRIETIKQKISLQHFSNFREMRAIIKTLSKNRFYR